MKRTTMILLMIFLTGCATMHPRLKTAEGVDIDSFMGKWYVIACIPVFIENKAYNEVEEYQRLPDGSIDTVLTFRQGSFDGPAKRYNPRGFVVDKVNNSTWKMQFVWPIKAEYLITYVASDYSQTIISRNKRDYVWIMARTPQVSPEEYQQLVEKVKDQGYRIDKLRQVPQRWP